MYLSKAILFLFSVFAFITLNVFAADKVIECSGKNNSQYYCSDADIVMSISFTETKNTDGLRVLKQIRGKIESTIYSEPELLAEFNLDFRNQDSNYHPRKYKAYNRFLNITPSKYYYNNSCIYSDEFFTANLILPNTNAPNFNIHYLWQADQIGGSWELKCTTKP